MISVFKWHKFTTQNKTKEKIKKTQHAICFVLYSWFQFRFQKAATGVRLGVYSETLDTRKHLN